MSPAEQAYVPTSSATGRIERYIDRERERYSTWPVFMADTDFHDSEQLVVVDRADDSEW